MERLRRSLLPSRCFMRSVIPETIFFPMSLLIFLKCKSPRKIAIPSCSEVFVAARRPTLTKCRLCTRMATGRARRLRWLAETQPKRRRRLALKLLSASRAFFAKATSANSAKLISRRWAARKHFLARTPEKFPRVKWSCGFQFVIPQKKPFLFLPVK